MGLSSDQRITSIDELLEPFHEAEKPRERWRIGTEAEKVGITRDGAPVPYAGERGVHAVLQAIAARFGWEEDREVEGGPLIALRRDDASITLEPGAQLELSGAPLATIHETAAEFRGHLAELEAVSGDLGIAWLGLGFHPLARREELSWVPKLRYGVMQKYLPTRGAYGLDMMLRTCTVQANLDYANEADAIRKLQISLRLQPVVTAMFANSPFVEGRATGERSHRARVWLDVDNDRSGLLPFAWEGALTYARYVEWALDVPMFLVKRHGAIVHNTGQTFRAFLRDGFEGTHATKEDWVTHVNTLFPEVRLKRTLEMRGGDSLPTDLTPALPALWKGLLYDDVALAQAERVAHRYGFAEAQAARPEIADRALRARIGSHEVGVLASELVAIANGGLERLANRDEHGNDERIHLAPLAALVARGESPADAVLAKIDASLPLVPQLLEHARL